MPTPTTYYLLPILIYLTTNIPTVPIPYRLNDGMANAQYNLGVALAEMGRRSEARERYQIAASLEPNTMVRWLDFTWRGSVFMCMLPSSDLFG